MFTQPSATSRSSSCDSADQLYQVNLDACIEGLENFPVERRQDSGSNLFTVSSAKRAVKPPTPVEPSHSLPSPPLSPPQRMWWSSSLTPSPSATTTMNRSLLHGGPPRGHTGSQSGQFAQTSQDARSNLAIQPAANTGSFKLKKNAVKIVRAAGPAPRVPLPQTPSQAPPSTSKSTPLSSSTLSQAKAQPTALDIHKAPEDANAAVAAAPTPIPSLPLMKIDLPSPTLNKKSSLDDMFARLSASISTMPSRPAEEGSLTGPDKSLFSFENDPPETITTMATPGKLSPSEGQVFGRTDTSIADLELPRTGTTESDTKVEPSQALSTQNWQNKPQSDVEQEYLRKATMYISALPSGVNTDAHTVKIVLSKLHNSYAPDIKLSPHDDVERLRARYVFAVVNYLNEKLKLNPEPATVEFIKDVLRDSDGDLLRFCATLVEKDYISLGNLDHVVGLCSNILNVLPKSEATAATAEPQPVVASSVSTVPTTPSGDISKTVPTDPVEGMKAWPTQQKREHGAIYRTCVLKGVSSVKSLNELQALVWGGRLESISMPEAGSEHALVKFLTAEACQTYLDATENGIEIQGDTKKTFVFVDKKPGPNSINDVIENCIKNDASRCIRATGADDDWSDGALLKLARGKQQIKRDVDRVKQGKNAAGHHYIEFRFGNIYHALSFKRQIMDHEEWEHCSIGYAPDPCEVARGVHYKDADEESSGIST